MTSIAWFAPENIPGIFGFRVLFHSLIAEMIARKLECIYVIWPILLFFLALAAVGTRNFSNLRETLNFDGKWLGAYTVLVGGLFFGPSFFSHSMLKWPLDKFVPSMLFSWLMAALPVSFYLIRAGKDLASKHFSSAFYLFFIVHAVMALSYILSPFSLIE